MSASSETLSWEEHMAEYSAITSAFASILQSRCATFVQSLDHIASRQPKEDEEVFQQEVQRIVENLPTLVAKPLHPAGTTPHKPPATDVAAVAQKPKAPSAAELQAAERANTMREQQAALLLRIEQLKAVQGDLAAEEEQYRLQQQARRPTVVPESFSFSPRAEPFQAARDGDSLSESPASSSAPSNLMDAEETPGRVAEVREGALMIPSAVVRGGPRQKPKSPRVALVPKSRNLNGSNCAAYFNLAEREQAVDLLKEAVSLAQQQAELAMDDVDEDAEAAQAELDAQLSACRKLIAEIGDEKNLLEEMCNSMVATCETDLQTVEAALTHQLSRQQALEAQLHSVIAQCTAKTAEETVDEALPAQSALLSLKSAEAASSDDDDDDDEKSSDEDDLATGDKQVIFMPNGQVRMCVSAQTTLSQAGLFNSLDDFRFEKLAGHEKAVRKVVGALQTHLDQLVQCNEKFDGELVCPLCHTGQTELLVMWPCGHQFCPDCVFANADEVAREYICPDCRNSSTDMPIANVAVNNVTGRITFKKSGFGNLQRAFATFRKRLFDVETNFVAQVSTYYRSLSDDVEFNSYENVVARREVR